LYKDIIDFIKAYTDYENPSIDGDYIITNSYEGMTYYKIRVNNDGYIDYTSECIMLDDQEVIIREWEFTNINTTKDTIINQLP
jgi:hypothetical protein